jgi:hypothetical protein
VLAEAALLEPELEAFAMAVILSSCRFSADRVRRSGASS